MLKIIGSIFVIVAAGMLGYQCGEQLKREYKELLYLQHLMYLLQSEIRYTRAYMGEAFYHIGTRVREPYHSWLTAMSHTLNQKEQGFFADVWERSIGEHLTKSGISKAELSRLSELGAKFSTSDMELQMKTLELYQDQLTLAINEKREEMRTKVRLCHCLGIMGGIFLTVLFV